jgi:hypothetical protein
LSDLIFKEHNDTAKFIWSLTRQKTPPGETGMIPGAWRVSKNIAGRSRGQVTLRVSTPPVASHARAFGFAPARDALRCRLRLAREAFAKRGVVGQVAVHDLDDGVIAQTHAKRLVRRAHASAAQTLIQAILAG